MRRLVPVVLLLVLVAAACAAGGDPSAGPATTPPQAAEPPDPGTEAAAPTPARTAPEGTGATATASPEAGATEPPATVSTERWSAVGDAPQALTEVAAATLGGMVMVAGGLDAGGRAVATVAMYDPVFARWSAGPSLPEAVHHTAMVSTGDEVLQIGGYAGSGFDTPVGRVHRFDAADGTWAEVAPLPEPRAAGAAAWDGERVVYAGGVGPDGLAGDVFAFDPAAGTWSVVGALSEPREHLAAAGDGQGRVWFLGGRTGGLDSNLATVELVTGDEVTRLGDLPTPRGGVAGFFHADAGACAVGGEAPEETFGEVECMDADGAATTLPELRVPRHGAGAAVAEGIAYVLLGGPEPQLTVSASVEALRLD